MENNVDLIEIFEALEDVFGEDIGIIIYNDLSGHVFKDNNLDGEDACMVFDDITQLKDKMNKKFNKNETVIITVRGGVANTFYNPGNVQVAIVDYDNLNAGDCSCPNCFEDGILEDGICSNCGFDTNDLSNNLE